MKKNWLSIIAVFLITGFVFLMPINSEEVSAKTVGDLKKELEELEATYQKNQNEQKLTQEQINTTYSEISKINDDMEAIEVERLKLTKEIEQLSIEIDAKTEEINNIINYMEIASGESAYLEYTFGAQSFTDFIYRVSVSEQLTTHNEELINEYNDLIKQNNERKIELNKKEVELTEKKKELNEKLASLGSHLDEITDITVDVEEEIKLQREAIDMYQNQLGCSDDEDITVCGIKYLPEATNFYRPVENGAISSYYGWRCYYLKGKLKCGFHYGVDIWSYDYHPNIYAAAPGIVAGITYKYKCGGNMVYIHHKIVNSNGTVSTYTTSYFHLSTVKVSIGDVVTASTVIGTMGGDSTTPWDGCTTGQHLHFSIAEGLYLKDYYYWSSYQAANLDPLTMLNFPSDNRYFTSRIIKYD